MKSDAQGTRKAAVAYILWARWVMQMLGLMAGVVAPLLNFARFLDPNLCHCGMSTQLVETFIWWVYMTVMVAVTLEAVFQTHHRGSQSWIQVLFVALFLAAGSFYTIYNFVLITSSLSSIASGTVGAWVVTERKPPTGPAKTQVETCEDEEALACKTVAGPSDEILDESTSTCSSKHESEEM
jgi:hypothetical protein